ncbi:SDR family oxidoreductase [Pseudonocardia sp. Ae505_Ps2]|uniref:SDR family NAD(P)-dependent oxidoreductase n=1 Tax=Pseudonocardia sp. Ae505_Ps2 TaxID=1885034 RepID=UPI00094E1F46|nr:SDR family oxidoreductase [Pseudonocardia sp. Ae505_Ps2]OLM14098.1 Short-chain dehydrogenase/reductase SDR [Pseudonocardia sp. Ae505_Ps2]
MTRSLVTGATAGIGHGFADELARRGQDLVLVARDAERLAAVSDDLATRHRVQVETIVADLSDREGTRAVADRLSDDSSPVDLLVNNAGSGLAAWFGATDIADEERQLDRLVRAPMVLMDAALKSMAGRGGAIINVASLAAFTPRGTYSASKAFVVNLSQWANLHYGEDGIRVLALCPGFVRTEFHARGEMDMSGIKPWMWLSVETVVRAALADLDRGRAVSIPGRRYKLLATLARHAPAAIVARQARRGRD